MLKIGIIGLGGVGGYIGAKLIQKDLCDVTLFARGKHFEAIKNNGLTIKDMKDEFIVKPKKLIDANSDDDDEMFDVIFITVKSYSFRDISEILNRHSDEGTLIIPLSNGVNHKAEINSYLQKGIVLDGCVYILSNIREPGIIEKKALTFYLIFGDTKNRFQEKLQKLFDLFNESGLKTKLSQNIEYDCWSKYLLISSFATLTSYFDKPMGYIVEEKMPLLRDVLKEIRSVANALHVEIRDAEIQKTIKQVQNVPYDSKTSMQIDFENGNKTELESLTGYIVKEAQKQGIEVKNMNLIYKELLKRSI
ncbi:MAG: ketopantoate reductase family protein [Sulfurospirillum sp.]